MKKNEYIKFNRYEIIKINLEKVNIDDIRKNEGVEHFYQVFPLQGDLSEIDTYHGVKIFGNEDFPYNVEVVLKGNFSLHMVEVKMKEEMILFNIPAIQYPYLRSAVSMASSLANGNYKTVILPTVNFLELMKEEKIENIIIKK